MKAGTWIKALLLWIGIVILAILNGALREKILIPVVGSPAALIISGLILSFCVFLVAFLAAPWYRGLLSSHYWFIGALWLVLTLLFEFGFGRFVQHQSWNELLEPYMFRGGNIWPVVVAATFVSPWLAARLRGMV